MQLPKTVCQDNFADDVVRRYERIVSEALNALDIAEVRELVKEIENREDCGVSNHATFLAPIKRAPDLTRLLQMARLKQ
jgi:tetrahydromethanopterin S-methyltransferase subunit A